MLNNFFFIWKKGFKIIIFQNNVFSFSNTFSRITKFWKFTENFSPNILKMFLQFS